MQSIPNNGNSLLSMVPFVNHAAQSRETNLSEMQAKVDCYYQNLEVEIEESRQLSVCLLEQYDDVIRQINSMVRQIELAEDKEYKSHLELKKHELEQRGISILDDFKENELHCEFLERNEEYLDLLIEEQNLLGENEIRKEILEDLKQVDVQKAYMKSIEYFQTLHTINEFRTQLQDIKDLPAKEQEIWKAIMESTSPAINSTSLFFKVMDKNGNVGDEQIEMWLPFSIWKAHGKLFEKACLSKDKTPFVIKASDEGLNRFINCLASCRSDKFLTYENLEEMMTLAQKFKVEWLFNDCYQLILRCMKELENLNTYYPIPQNEINSLRSQLSFLAQKFKLADLQCFTRFSSKILPDGTVSLKGSVAQMHLLDRADLIHYVGFHNPLHTPKLEFHVQNFSAGDGMILDQILKRARCRIAIKIDEKIPADLDQILGSAPNLKHLKILFDCFENNPQDLFQMMINNTTLTSLNLRLMNYDNEDADNFQTLWPIGKADASKYVDGENAKGLQYKHEVNAAKRDLRKMIRANDRIRNGLEIALMKITIMQSSLGINFEAFEDKMEKGLGPPSSKKPYQPYVVKYSGRDSNPGDL